MHKFLQQAALSQQELHSASFCAHDPGLFPQHSSLRLGRDASCWTSRQNTAEHPYLLRTYSNNCICVYSDGNRHNLSPKHTASLRLTLNSASHWITLANLQHNQDNRKASLQRISKTKASALHYSEVNRVWSLDLSFSCLPRHRGVCSGCLQSRPAYEGACWTNYGFTCSGVAVWSKASVSLCLSGDRELMHRRDSKYQENNSVFSPSLPSKRQCICI